MIRWKFVATPLLLAVATLALVAGRTVVPGHAANINQDCTLVVPANALSAQGLASPYLLTATDPAAGPCNEADPNQSAFVQADVFDPATGAISTYSPVIVDMGATPAAAPVVPTLPPGAIVALWFGDNGNVLRLQGATPFELLRDRCVTGLPGSPFGQVSACNAPTFFAAANAAIAAGQTHVPPLGVARDGQTCPTVRDFAIVDQDQSDNVTTRYLFTPDGRVAQDTAANAAALGTFARRGNPSDNGLLRAVDGALGCVPWSVPDLANPGAAIPTQATDELQARFTQGAPVALVPMNDPMVLVNAQPSIIKQDLYRLIVDQQPIFSRAQDRADQTAYCQSILQVGVPRVAADMPFTIGAGSPVPTAGDSLFTFLAQRLAFTWGADGLNCQGLLGIANPVALTLDQNSVTVAAVITLNPGPAAMTGGQAGGPSKSDQQRQGAGGRGQGQGNQGQGQGGGQGQGDQSSQTIQAQVINQSGQAADQSGQGSDQSGQGGQPDATPTPSDQGHDGAQGDPDHDGH